jgi:predicted XRE-type DNA-binding protein
MSIAPISRGTLAGNIRAEIARHQVEQATIAEALGRNQQYVSRRVTGAVPWRGDELEIVAAVLGVHVAELVGGRPPRGYVPPQRGSATHRYPSLAQVLPFRSRMAVAA